MSGGPDIPETYEMAREWDRRAVAYRRAGLCDPCASSASWGHAVGWLRVPSPPCSLCAAIVATFPKETVHPAWRKWPQGRRSVAPMRSSTWPDVQASPDRPTALSGRQA